VESDVAFHIYNIKLSLRNDRTQILGSLREIIIYNYRYTLENVAPNVIFDLTTFTFGVCLVN